MGYSEARFQLPFLPNERNKMRVNLALVGIVLATVIGRISAADSLCPKLVGAIREMRYQDIYPDLSASDRRWVEELWSDAKYTEFWTNNGISKEDFVTLLRKSPSSQRFGIVLRAGMSLKNLVAYKD